MTSQHPGIAYELASSKQHSMLQRADMKRLNELASEQSRIPHLRERLGLAIVRFGQHVAAGRERLVSPVDASDRAVSAGVLRLSR